MGGGGNEHTLNFDSFSDWYLNGHLASYVKGINSFPTKKFSYIEVMQPEGDMSDPPIPDFVLGTLLNSDVRTNCDFGGGQISQTVRKNDLWLVPPDVSTKIDVFASNHLRFISVGKDYITNLLGHENAPPDFRKLHTCFFRDGFISDHMKRLWAETKNEDCISNLYVDICLVNIFERLNFLSLNENYVSSFKGGLSKKDLLTSINYIHDYFHSNLSLMGLALNVGLSPSHFCRSFKVSTGYSPYQYQLLIRIDRAKDLIVKTSTSMTEVAMITGYESLQSFSRAFKKVTGVSPQHYRKLRC